jgi:hypothetical protein
MTELIDTISQNIMTAYIAQMRSALKISNILSEHNTDSDELTGDDIICGLVYRLMIPMSNSEMIESLEETNKIMDPSGSEDEGSEGEEYDEIEEKYEKPLVSRKIKTNNCNCDICSKVRVCLINFSDYETKDQLAQKFKDSITETCEIHKIQI